MRIIRVSPDETNYLMHVINSVGNELDYQTARVFVQNLVDYECLSLREAKLILGALRDSAIPMQGGTRNRLRAAIFKNMLLALQ